MKILLTAHRFWPHVGGTEIAVERLAERFAAAGHDVTVATGSEPGAAADESRNGYRVRRFELTRRAGFRVPPKEYYDFVEGDWDIVHLHGQRIWSTDYLYRRLARVRGEIVFTAHGFYQYHMERTPIVDTVYYRVVLPRALRHVARVVALTSPERAELLSWGVDARKIATIPDGYDPGEFASLPSGFRARHALGDGPLLLYVGGFYPNKRVDRLVEVAALAKARLVVIGKDQDPRRGRSEARTEANRSSTGRAHCEALASKLGADVRFLGTLPREDVLAAYKESDVFVLASDFEGYALVLLEAMAAGLPFVSTPAGAAPDLAARGAGILAEDAKGLASAARALLDDPARRREMGDAGKRVAPEFTWDRVAQRYLALFEEVTRR